MSPPRTDAIQAGAAPPLLSPQSNSTNSSPGSARRFLSLFLSLCLALFLVDAVASFADSSLILCWNLHVLSLFAGLTSFAVLVMSAAVYGLIGLTPAVPKRVFLPIPIFTFAAMLAMFPVMIYFLNRLQQISWAIALGQVILAVALLYQAQGRLGLRWPLVQVQQLGARGFSWLNLSVFLLLNVFILLPAVVIYLFACAALAVNHLSDGFMALHPNGFSVQVRKYVRDGKTIELFPMSHVADARFYHRVSQTFPTNSVILMEGVTDEQNLLTNKISYRRMAKSLGLSEQRKEFVPTRGEIIDADVDVDQFSPDTIGFLNLVMLIHSRGLTPATLETVMKWSPPVRLQNEVVDDLLRKRNHHLLEEIHAELGRSDNIMVPWGVAHMPGISKLIQQEGFQAAATNNYMVIRFGRHGNEKSPSPSR